MAGKDIALTGIPSLKDLTKCCSQSRVIKALSWNEWRAVQWKLSDDRRYATKSVMARRVYAEMFKPCAQPPMIRTGWNIIPGVPLIVGNDMTDGVPASGRYLPIQEQAFKLWEVPGLTMEMGRAPEANIVVRFEHLDGEGGVLGMTLRYAEGDLGRGGQQVIVTVDLDEVWTPLYFFTVFAHEIGHALGHPHYRVGNLMYSRFAGIRQSLGPQDVLYHDEKYGHLDTRFVGT